VTGGRLIVPEGPCSVPDRRGLPVGGGGHRWESVWLKATRARADQDGVTNTVQGSDVDTGVPGPPKPKSAATYLRSLPLAVQIALGIVLAVAVLAVVHVALSASSGCPAGTYKDVSYLTGNTFCGSSAPSAPTTTVPGATQAQIDQGCPAYDTEAACASAIAADSTTTTTAPPVTAPTPNFVGMSVWDAEQSPSVDNGWTVSGANETCDGGATDYVVSQSPAAGTIETADGLGDFGNVTLVGSCPD